MLKYKKTNMKTKIIATLGLETCSKKVVKEMILAWASIFRCNLSHWDVSWHKRALVNVKKAWDELWVRVYTLLDTKWPEIRTWMIKWKANLKKWNKLILSSTNDLKQFNKTVSVKKVWKVSEILISHPNLYKNKALKKWGLISLDSGKISLKIEKIENSKIYTEILNDGILSSKRHINVPWIRIELPILRKIDKEGLRMWIENKVDFVAVSFVRDKSDVLDVKKFLWSPWKKIKIISKVEHFEALKNIDDIITLSDEIMVARGDLWIEMPFYKVPLLEEMLIKKSIKAWKPVIVATQMLISMTENIMPTRAETTDVALAVQFWANKIMLSDETASWKYPIKSIEVMKKIAEYTEKNGSRIRY